MEDRQPAAVGQSRLRSAVILVALTQLALQAAAVLRGTEHAVVHLTVDDSYYYLQTAWGVRAHGFPTFDGINPTNGVQFLWFWMLVLVAHLVPTKAAMLPAALWLCCALNAACHLPIWKLGTQVGRPLLALLCSTAWLCATARGYLSSMENSLHALLCWSALALAAASLRPVAGPAQASRRLTYAAVLATLLVWARLDSAPYAAALYLLVAWTLRGEGMLERRGLLRSAALAALGALLLFGGFHAMGGSALPVSALIKQTHAGWDPRALLTLVGRGVSDTLPLARLPLRVLPGEATAGLVGVAVIAAGVAVAWRSRHRATYTGLALLVGSHLVLLSSGGGFALYAHWYLSPYLCFCALTGAFLALAVHQRLGARGHSRLALGFALLFVGSGVVGGVRSHVAGLRAPVRSGDFYLRRVGVARWMDEHLPDGARCAAWNAGALGYFSDVPVTNLDGLINSADFARQVLWGPTPLADFLTRQGTSCVVDYEIKDDSIAAAFAHARPVGTPPPPGDSRQFRIWTRAP